MKGSEEILEKVGDYTLSANDVTDSKILGKQLLKDQMPIQHQKMEVKLIILIQLQSPKQKII